MAWDLEPPTLEHPTLEPQSRAGIMVPHYRKEIYAGTNKNGLL